MKIIYIAFILCLLLLQGCSNSIQEVDFTQLTQTGEGEISGSIQDKPLQIIEEDIQEIVITGEVVQNTGDSVNIQDTGVSLPAHSIAHDAMIEENNSKQIDRLSDLSQ